MQVLSSIPTAELGKHIRSPNRILRAINDTDKARATLHPPTVPETEKKSCREMGKIVTFLTSLTFSRGYFQILMRSDIPIIYIYLFEKFFPSFFTPSHVFIGRTKTSLYHSPKIFNISTQN
jgi:sulfatase maturation enzyme AslB (radical SAM superfamily)